MPKTTSNISTPTKEIATTHIHPEDRRHWWGTGAWVGSDQRLMWQPASHGIVVIMQRQEVRRWLPSAAGLVFAALCTLACVLVLLHAIRVDAAYQLRVPDPGVFATPPENVWRADSLQGLVWIASFLAALAVAVLGSHEVDSPRVVGSARALALVVQMLGVVGLSAGVVLAVFGFIEML
ncbi:hypothetical protein [Curtobacterium sp. MCBD17_040]|uniref:hypothetical protein n=1 Tax=Curtobacterium sp. MCBD17_040 TaxID=2175674 RepID=UPI0011B5B071|nr:hypothetical protein [Curtobacterium sp. MCBD17_040]WIB65782.1 hypothetical protein DEI94_16845 [Curtobacterium sp. MCBD17_040]